MTLEDILQKYFGLKGNAFLKYPKDNEVMTVKGIHSYIALIEVLNAVNNLVGIDNFIDLIDRLDKLTRESE